MESTGTNSRILTPEEYSKWYSSMIAKPESVVKAAALIMCGGLSTRMHEDKALVKIGSETLLERAARFWKTSGLVSEIYAAVGRKDHFDSLPDGVTPVYDLVEARGPLAGLQAAFHQTDAEFLYVSAVDMPGIKHEAILPPPAGDVIVYSVNGKIEPLFGVYRRSVVSCVDRLLAAGEGKLRLLLDSVDTQYVSIDADKAQIFNNVNDPLELNRFRAGNPPAVCIMGWSGSGKTTFIEKLIPELTARGLRLAVIKHDAHGMDMDTPGKDTWRFKEAGASSVSIISPGKFAVISDGDPDTENIRRYLPTDSVDLLIYEGFKYSSLPKLELRRKVMNKPFICKDNSLIGYISDEAIEYSIPVFGLEDFSGCADFIIRTFLKR